MALTPSEYLNKIVKKNNSFKVTSDSSGVCYFPYNSTTHGVILLCSVAVSSSFHPVMLYTNDANNRLRAQYYFNMLNNGAITKFTANTEYSFECVYIPAEYYG